MVSYEVGRPRYAVSLPDEKGKARQYGPWAAGQVVQLDPSVAERINRFEREVCNSPAPLKEI